MIPNCFPSLRPDAHLRIVEEQVELELDDAIVAVSGVPAQPLLQALASMNGKLDLSGVGRQSALDVVSVEGVVKRLVEVGALSDIQQGGPRTLSPERFTALCGELYKQWKARLFAHPLWVGLANGSLPRQVFVGWVVESWLFIEGVMDRLPMAIANTDNPAMRQVFTRHFSEEWSHFHFFEQALDALGVSAGQRAQARPLPATRAVQHWMRMSARRDPLRYAACSGFLESTGSDRVAARTFFEQVGSWYDGADRGGVTPMADHVALDEEYGHDGFVHKIVRELSELEWERARAALQDAYGLMETLEMWSSDILHHYQGRQAFPLRTTRAYRGALN